MYKDIKSPHGFVPSPPILCSPDCPSQRKFCSVFCPAEPELLPSFNLFSCQRLPQGCSCAGAYSSLSPTRTACNMYSVFPQLSSLDSSLNSSSTICRSCLKSWVMVQSFLSLTSLFHMWSLVLFMFFMRLQSSHWQENLYTQSRFSFLSDLTTGPSSSRKLL